VKAVARPRPPGAAPAWAVLAAAWLCAAPALADLGAAERLEKESRFAEAAAEYERLLQAAPRDPALLRGAARCLVEKSKAEASTDGLWAAQKRLEALVALAPGEAEHRFLSGLCASMLAAREPAYAGEMLEKAAAEFRETLRLNPGHWEALFQLGQALERKGDGWGALEAYGRVTGARPDAPEPWQRLALLEYSMGFFADSVKAARRLIELCPDYAFAHKIAGDGYAAGSAFGGAEAEYLLGAAAEPAEAAWSESLWLLFQRLGDLARAVEVFSRLVKDHPDAEPPRKFLAHALKTAGRHEEAAAQLEELTRRFPAEPWYWLWRGESLAALGRDPEAVDAFLAALRARPDFSNAYAPLRDRFQRLKSSGRHREAVELLRRVSACNPSPAMHGWVLWDLAENLRLLGDVKGATDALRKAIETDPLEPGFPNSLALDLRALGRSGEAVERFRAALDIDPGHLYALEGLATTLQSLGRDAEAKECFEKGLAAAQEQAAQAADPEKKSEKEFYVFVFGRYLHETEDGGTGRGAPGGR
jgi:tetratricopeptide (TPR) repeat protein